MKPSRKYISLPIVSLSEGQHIGYVKSLIIDAQNKALAALVIDPKGFFKDQRIIPYSKVISVGDDAITIDKESHVEKSTSIPEILTLLREKLTLIGTKVITQNGKTLGIAEEYYVDPENGKITHIEISGGKLEGLMNGKAWLSAEYINTIGHDVIVAEKGSESYLNVSDKGLNDTFKSLVHTTSHFAAGTTQAIAKYFKKDKNTTIPEDIAGEFNEPSSIPTEIAMEPSGETQNSETTQNTEAMPEQPSTKEPLG